MAAGATGEGAGGGVQTGPAVASNGPSDAPPATSPPVATSTDTPMSLLPVTDRQVERVKDLVAQLRLEPDDWKSIVQRYGGTKLAELNAESAGELVAWLVAIQDLRALRNRAMLDDQSWAAAMKKRHVTRDLDLDYASVNQLWLRLEEILQMPGGRVPSANAAAPTAIGSTT